ncbi:WxcM-like, C-terminal [Prevotella denticola]|uniref:WxcM-like, C-terminal n=1 Tax=Prevotella denticola TaxID=28129 RepID=A0A379E397_9BACT|nr:WxcM-like, C-terminal [Prevotella denticola]
MNDEVTSLGKIISLQKVVDPRGNLTVAQGMKDIPFHVARVYWTYDVPSGTSRGDMHISIAVNSLLL